MDRWRVWIWPLSIVVAGTLLRLYALGDDPFWVDEAHSANFTRLSLNELLSWAEPYDRGNPPGYIVLLKIWTQVSRSEIWMRALSALAGILTLLVVYLIGTRLFTRRVGIVAMAFLAVAGYHIRFSQEARAYALMGLLAAGVMLAVAQLMSQPDGDHADRVRGDRPWAVKEAGLGLRRPLTWTDLAWPAYTLLAGGAFLFHVTGVGIAAAANIAVALWWLKMRPRPPRFARNWIISNLGVLVIWMAWIPAFVRQVGDISGGWWVPEPTFLSVMEGGADLIAPSFGWNLPWNGPTWGAATLVLVSLLLIWVGLRKSDYGPKFLIWSFLLTLPAIELGFSIRTPIFLTRTLLWVMIPLSLGLALAATRPRRLWPATTAALIVVSLAGGVAYHATSMKTAWDEAASLVAAHVSEDDLVLIQPSHAAVGFNHYFDKTDVETTIYGVPFRLPDRTATGSAVTPSDRDQVEALSQSRDEVWLVLNRPDEGDSLRPTLEPLAAQSERFRLFELVILRYEMR